MQGVAVAWVGIASPGDLNRERDTIERSISEWNQRFARNTGMVFLTLRWERDATPVVGRGDAQEIINQDIIDKSDVLVGIFGTRLGTATARAISGTVEEIEAAQYRGLHPHVFFSSKAIPRGHDPDQFRELTRYRQKLSQEGLLAEFATLSDLTALVHRALTQEAEWAAATVKKMWHGGVGVCVRFEPLLANDGSLQSIRIFNEGAGDVSRFTIKSIMTGNHSLRSPLLGRKLTLAKSGQIDLQITRSKRDLDEVDILFSFERGNHILNDEVKLEL